MSDTKKIKKISVCGKGGSGKSTITTLLANEMKFRGYQVLVIDSDESNSGLYRMLGFSHPPTPLMELAGGKKQVQRVMKSKFSEGKQEPEINILAQQKIRVNEIPAQYIISLNNISLVNIGKILQFLEGCACPMGVLSREFLSRLSLDNEEIAIVDMEAGIEHFGRGVESSIDSLLIVVEPSFESLYLAEKIRNLAKEAGMERIFCILTKVPSEKIASKLRDELRKRNIDVIASIPYDQGIFQSCLDGSPLEAGKVEKEVKKILNHLV